MLFSINALLTIVTVAIALGGCGEPHHEAAQQYLALAESVLMENGVCSSAADCEKKELVFWEGGEVNLGVIRWGGVYVNLYATRDTVLVDAVVSRFKEAHAQKPAPQITLTVFSSSHSQPKVQFHKVVFK